MARKEDLRFVRTNKKLYNTFYELIKSQNVDQLSITDICDAAEINRATFYKHFDDKKAFVFYCVAQKIYEQRKLNASSAKYNTGKLHERVMLEVFAYFRYINGLNSTILDANGYSVRMLYDALMHLYFNEFVEYYSKGDYNDEYLDVKMRAAQNCGALLNMALYALLQGEDALTDEACFEIVRARIG